MNDGVLSFQELKADPGKPGVESVLREVNKLKNCGNIISSISVADIVFNGYLGKWNYTAIPKVKN